MAHAAHSAHSAHATHAAHATEGAKTTTKEVIMATSSSEEIVSHVLLLIFFGSSLAALFTHAWLLEAESMSHKVFILVEKGGEGISSPEELSEDLISVTECEVASSKPLEASSELRAASASSIEHVLATVIIKFAFVLIRQALISLAYLLKYLLSLHFHRLV
jgi:hypothetical protein